MNDDIKKVLFNKEEIDNKVSEIAEEITNRFQDKNPVIISILKGAVTFTTDLIRKLDFPIEIDFMVISSYGLSTKSSGVVKIKKDIDVDISGKNVIIVEDIVDSGLTMKYLKEYLWKHNPVSVNVCTLLDKPDSHKVDIAIDFKGYDIGNEFVVGYGLDYAEKYRNLPYIGILKEEVYNA